MDDIFIGTDILTISRLESILSSSQNDRFLDRIFTSNEIKYCQSQANPALHFAGRFSAKESIKKAVLSSNIISHISLKDIEILRENNGAPTVNLLLELPVKYKCKVTISHSDESAVAFAVLIITS